MTEDPYADAWPIAGRGYVLTPTLFIGEPSASLPTTHVTDPIEAAVLIMAGAMVILDGADAWARGAETMLLLGMGADWIRLRRHFARTAHTHDDVQEIERCERRYWSLLGDGPTVP